MCKDGQTADDFVGSDFSLAGFEFFKFSAFAGITGLFVSGYSYVDTFYSRFGLGLHEFGIGHLESIEFTVFLLRDPYVLFSSIGVIFVFSVVAAWIRYSFGSFGFYVSFATLFLLFVYLAGYGGSLKANTFADGIIQRQKGQACLL